MTEENNTENAETSSVVGPGLPPPPSSSEPLPPPPSSSEPLPPPPNSAVVGQQSPSGLPTWLISDWLVVIGLSAFEVGVSGVRVRG